MHVPLLHDGALVLQVAPPLWPLVSPWVPSLRGVPGGTPLAVIDVRVGLPDDVIARDLGAAPLLELDAVRASRSSAEVVHLTGESARGLIHLATRRADIVIETSRLNVPAHADIYAMLTISAAMLVGRLGGALIHGGAIIDDGGGAWLLVGDSHAGKTTTCVSLVDAGWRYLADDQVVLRGDDAGSLVVEGWPRQPHLDAGWTSGTITGQRVDFDVAARWPDRWRRTAPLAGLLLPRVCAERETSVRRVKGADALAAIVRQSPWLLADAGEGERILTLLSSAVALPAFSLSLGRDSYANGVVLARRLHEAFTAEPTSPRA